MSYFRSINQAVVVSPGNTDTSNLPVGGVFTGIGESTLGVNSIQVNFKADQNCTVYVEQGPDATTMNISDAFNYYNGTGGTGFTTQATDAYARVRVKNNGTASTLTKTLSTVFCPIVEALPRALSLEGNLKTDIYGIIGDFGTEVLVSPMMALKTVESFRLAGISFGSAFDTNFWALSTTGSGTATTSGGELTLADGTTASSTVKVQSVRRARYIPANTNFYRGQVTLPDQTGQCTRRWGAYDSTDGYFYQYDGTHLAIGARKSSVDTTVVEGSFNGSWGITYPVPNNTINTYEIFWTNKSAYYFINNEILHTITATTTTAVGTPHLMVGMECSNGTGNTANNRLVLRSSTINRLGPAETSPHYTYASAMSASAVVLKNGPGRLHKVVINQLSGNNGDRLTLYDASGTTNVFSIFNTNQVASIGAIDYHLDFYNGLSYVFNGSGGTPNCTIIYE